MYARRYSSGSLPVEGVDVGLGRPVVAREVAPHLLAGPGRQPELALLELELELLPEQFGHVLLAAPVAAIAGAGLACRPEGRMHVLGLRIGPPGDHAEAPARAADARKLAAGRGVVGSEEDPERGSDDIEARVLVREALRVPDLEPDADALLAREPPRRVDHDRRQIDTRHACSRARRAQRDRAGARADVEPALTTAGSEPGDEVVVDGGESRCHRLPRRRAPRLALPRLQRLEAHALAPAASASA